MPGAKQEGGKRKIKGRKWSLRQEAGNEGSTKGEGCRMIQVVGGGLACTKPGRRGQIRGGNREDRYIHGIGRPLNAEEDRTQLICKGKKKRTGAKVLRCEPVEKGPVWTIPEGRRMEMLGEQKRIL